MNIKLIRRNFTPAQRGSKQIKKIVIHTYGAKGRSLYAWFNSPKSGVSAHYAVFRDGNVEMYVHPKNIAWHAGNAWWNSITIGIEHQDNGQPFGARTEDQYQASGQLVYNLAKRYHIPLAKTHIVPHRLIVKNRTCPGNLSIDKIIEIAKGLEAVGQEIPEVVDPQPDIDTTPEIEAPQPEIDADNDLDSIEDVENPEINLFSKILYLIVIFMASIQVTDSAKRGAKILGYVLATMALALIVSPEFRTFLESKPEIALYLPLINVLLGSLADILRQAIPRLKTFI